MHNNNAAHQPAGPPELHPGAFCACVAEQQQALLGFGEFIWPIMGRRIVLPTLGAE
jgi:hypothetical protein